MKAQVNEIIAAQEKSNKIMTISLILVGAVLFIVSGMNFWNDVIFNNENSFVSYTSTNTNFGETKIIAENFDNRNERMTAEASTYYALDTENALEVEEWMRN